jgi:hypothetical protein
MLLLVISGITARDLPICKPRIPRTQVRIDNRHRLCPFCRADRVKDGGGDIACRWAKSSSA